MTEGFAAAHGVVETRWAGAGLAAGAVLYMIAIALFAALYGHPEGTGPGGNVTLMDIAVHTRARWSLSQALWSTEMGRWIAMFAGISEGLSPLLGLTAFLLAGVLGLSIGRGLRETNAT